VGEFQKEKTEKKVILNPYLFYSNYPDVHGNLKLKENERIMQLI
jgi:hypothetical protein